MPKISVIIPVYNVEKYLRECLDSVCAQTFTDFEVICVDDGSTDSSPDILAEYAARDTRFKVIRREHSNAGACRNAGMDMAQGEYLSFLDSDDVFSPKMLELMLRAAESFHAEIVSFKRLDWMNGEPLPKLDQSYSPRSVSLFESPADNYDIFNLWGAQAWDKLFGKKFIDSYGLRFQEIRWTNDLRFVLLALSLARKVVTILRHFLAYRRGHVSLQTTRANKALCFFEALDSYREEALKLGKLSPGANLARTFNRFAVAFSFVQMDAADTSEAYETVHRAFMRYLAKWELLDLVEEDFEPGSPVFARYAKIREGGSPMETARFHEKELMKEVAELRPLRKVAESLDFRIGHMLLAFPRLLLDGARQIGKTLRF